MKSTTLPRSTTSTTTSTDFRRTTRPREAQFTESFGQRYHSYDAGKAPYPVSYDASLLEIEALDNQLVKHLRQGSVSFVNFDTTPPERCLDLGCGTGSWILDAAKEWPNCDFVGFDLVDVQLPLQPVEPSIASRVTFKLGNFLTTKLPFEDEEFDHVHVQFIAKAVPENKWDLIFEEISRVLCPGGSVEIIEEDVVFPRLPKWFTASLRRPSRRTASIHFPDGSQRGSTLPLFGEPMPDPQAITHEHALLESLYQSVFTSRFINTRPSAVLPSYMTTYFRHITLGPLISFPMPPIPPAQQQAPAAMALYNATSLSDGGDSLRLSTISSTREPAISFSSTTSNNTDDTFFSRTKSDSFSSVFEEEDDFKDKKDPGAGYKRFYLGRSLGGTAAASVPTQLFAVERLESLSERSLAMHLYRSYKTVIECREALWQELCSRMNNRLKEEELKQYGWVSSGDKTQDLESFEKLLTRYESDMRMRMALWCSLKDIGWLVPPRETISKAEMIEEEHVRQTMLEARKYADPEDLWLPSRSVRVIVGHKA